MLLALLLYARSMSGQFDGRPHMLSQTEARPGGSSLRFDVEPAESVVFFNKMSHGLPLPRGYPW